MNRCFRHAVVNAKPGGSQGGGAVLTEFGAELVRDYRAIETAAEVAAKKRLRGLEAALRKSRSGAAGQDNRYEHVRILAGLAAADGVIRESETRQ